MLQSAGREQSAGISLTLQRASASVEASSTFSSTMAPSRRNTVFSLALLTTVYCPSSTCLNCTHNRLICGWGRGSQHREDLDIGDLGLVFLWGRERPGVGTLLHLKTRLLAHNLILSLLLQSQGRVSVGTAIAPAGTLYLDVLKGAQIQAEFQRIQQAATTNATPDHDQVELSTSERYHVRRAGCVKSQ